MRRSLEFGRFLGYFIRMKTTVENIDAYIAQFEPPIQELLQTVRRCIARAAPQATEKISYGIPTFFLKKNLVHFAAAKHHIGFYPTHSGVARFEEALESYITSKGAIQFPLDRPLPTELIDAITRFRVGEVLAAREKPSARS